MEPEKTEAARSSLNNALKWLLLRREKQLDVLEEANTLLRAHNCHLNLAMICGRVRIGKSYFMNSLLGQPCFGVSSEARGFTQGVDICPKLIPAAKFGARPGGPHIGLIDIEGQGDKGLAQDLKLATPLLLVAKAVLLLEVCPTGPAKEAILESLQLMIHAGKTVSDRKDRRGLFGCLHVVLRDCAQDEAECRSIIFDPEDENEAETDEHAEAIARRNEIRKSISLTFEASPKVWCLPKIAEAVAPQDYRDAPYSFVAKIDEVRKALAQQLSEPKLLNGQPLTGRLIAALMPELAAAMKSDAPALNPPSLMDTVAQAEATRVGEELSRNLSQGLAMLSDVMPLACGHLEEAMRSQRERFSSKLASRLAALGACKPAKRAKADFESHADDLCLDLRTKNRALQEQLAETIRKDKCAQAKLLFAAICLPLAPKPLAHAIEKIKEEITGSGLEPCVVPLPEQLEGALRADLAGYLETLVKEKQGSNASEMRRRRLFFALPMLVAVVAILSLLLPADDAACGQIVAHRSSFLLAGPRCWRFNFDSWTEEARQQKEAQERKEVERQLEEQRRLEEERKEAAWRAEEHRLEEQRIEDARLRSMHEEETNNVFWGGLTVGGTTLGLMRMYHR